MEIKHKSDGSNMSQTDEHTKMNGLEKGYTKFSVESGHYTFTAK